MNKVIPVTGDIETGNPKMYFCCMCLENFSSDESLVFIKCKHYWCKNCDKNYSDNKCPLCRYEFKKKEESIIIPEEVQRDIECSIFCLIFNLIEIICNTLTFNISCTRLCRYYCSRQSCFYKFSCFKIYFKCENYKCKNIKFKVDPYLYVENCLTINIILNLLILLIIIIAILTLGRFAFLLISNPVNGKFFCNFICFFFTSIFGLFSIIIILLSFLIFISLILRCLACTYNFLIPNSLL